MDEDELEEKFEIRDSNGTLLNNGDAVLIIKDLKVKGGGVLKRGTKIKKYSFNR